jgi:hypothetical protein
MIRAELRRPEVMITGDYSPSRQQNLRDAKGNSQQQCLWGCSDARTTPFSRVSSAGAVLTIGDYTHLDRGWFPAIDELESLDLCGL